ncbi:MAG: winged helix-turn-helix domain-containing protein [Candidatus Nitrosopolaris sp.]
MKYRSRDDIMGLLLNAADGVGATKTKLMYSAFISFNQLKEYLSLLVENGLIQYEEGTHTYRTTEKGKRFLQIQNKIDEVSPIIYISENVSKAEIKFS